MVVVSGCWMRNNTQNVNYAEMSAAKAVLVSRPNSHPFEQRTLLLDQPVKVGRSVARMRATATNAIFDCKVLSRHHAIIWYDNGKFYLQDTKSSNGTFVNNNRLSGSSEGEAHEVSSGDIVQFGVDVMENNRKVTHGCIVAMVKLYLPDGKEAKASVATLEGGVGRQHSLLVPLDDLYKLHHVIQEASQRELCLETKLTALQQVVEAARRAADDSWQAYVGEERLLSRVATLETQLAQAAKNVGEERLREQLMQLHDERNVYQLAAKEALMKSHVERLAAVAHSSDEERARARAENEALLAKEQWECCQHELQQIVRKLMNEQRRADDERDSYEQKVKGLQEQLAELQDATPPAPTTTTTTMAAAAATIRSQGIKEEALEQALEEEEEEEEDNVDDADGDADGISNPLIEYEYDALHQSDFNLLHPDNDNANEANRNDLNCKETAVTNFINADGDTNNTTAIIMHGGCREDELRVENKDELTTGKEVVLAELLPPADSTSDFAAHPDSESDSNASALAAIDANTLKYQFHADEMLVKQMQIESLGRSLQEALAENLELCSELQLLKNQLVVLAEAKEAQVAASRDHVHVEVQTQSHVHDCSLQVDTSELAGEYGSTADTAATAANHKRHLSLLNDEVSRLTDEVVALKERYSHLNDEKLALNNQLLRTQSNYNALCDRTHNALFLYVAPLGLMVLYLLISSMFS